MSDTTYEAKKIAKFTAVKVTGIKILGLVQCWNSEGHRSHTVATIIAGERRSFDIDMTTGEVWEDA